MKRKNSLGDYEDLWGSRSFGTLDSRGVRRFWRRGLRELFSREELSRICLGVSVSYAASGLGAHPIMLYGNPETEEKISS